MNLQERLKGIKAPAKRQPLWTGPNGEGPNGGMTQGLLKRFLTCRERFRVYAVEGLRSPDNWNHRVGYGLLWHVCEEALAVSGAGLAPNRDDSLTNYASALCNRYPLQQDQVSHWYEVCQAQFPAYVEYWKNHPDVVNRTPLFQEQSFDVDYQLPSGRTVRLRGKWDAVDLITEGKRDVIWLFETKTKGDVDEEALTRQMTGDLQSMFYLVALQQAKDSKRFTGTLPEAMANRVLVLTEAPITGVKYNVIRRPLSGGKYTIVRHKATQGAKCPKCKGTGKSRASSAFGGDGRCKNCHGGGRINAKPEETKESFYGRVRESIESDPGHFFLRLNVPVSPADVADFRRRTLDPVLEQMLDWWEWIKACQMSDGNYFGPGKQRIHWQHPYGCSNTIDEYGWADVDSYLATGNETGLQRTDTLFSELT